MILIGRGLDQEREKEFVLKESEEVERYIKRCIVLKLLSDDSAEGTPVSIPNTVVKLRSADDTWRAAARESRALLR